MINHVKTVSVCPASLWVAAMAGLRRERVLDKERHGAQPQPAGGNLDLASSALIDSWARRPFCLYVGTSTDAGDSPVTTGSVTAEDQT